MGKHITYEWYDLRNIIFTILIDEAVSPSIECLPCLCGPEILSYYPVFVINAASLVKSMGYFVPYNAAYSSIVQNAKEIKLL